MTDMMNMTFPKKTQFVFFLLLQFKACISTTILSQAYPVSNGEDLELVCTHSTAIAASSTVSVKWIENGTAQGDIDANCNDGFGPVDTAQYGFSCPSIRNYTWTIKNVQESRNDSVWTCSISINTPTPVLSDPTTIYVISPITSVSIDGNTNVSADAGSQTTVSCTTSTGRPVSTIRWYFDAGTPSDTSDDIEITPTLEPVFDFGSETTSGRVTITAESNRNGWGIYATANNTESMTPIQSSNAVTLTVTDSPPAPCSPWCLCNLCECLLSIFIPLLFVGCIVGAILYCWCKEEYCFDNSPTWPCSSSKHNDDKSDSSVSQVKMDIMSTEKSDVAHKELSRNKSDGSDETENRPLSTTVETTNETSPETKSLHSTKHDGSQVNNQVVQTEGSSPSPIKKGHSKVGPGDNQRSGDPEKNTAGSIREVKDESINTPRPLPILPKIGSKESSQAPNMGDVEANKPKKKKKKKKGKETKEDQIV